MFVGDSLHYNQWQSMVCMVQSAVPPGKKSVSYPSAYIYRFKAEVDSLNLFLHLTQKC